jgi:stage V sporulation protein B
VSSDLLRSIRTNALATAGGNIARGALGFVAGVALARALGVEDRGQLGVVTTAVGVLGMLAGIGLSTALPQVKVRYGWTSSQLYAATTVSCLALSFLALFVHGLAFLLLSDSLYRSVAGGEALWIAALVLPVVLFGHLNVVGHLEGQVVFFTVAAMAGAVLFAAGAIGLLLIGVRSSNPAVALWGASLVLPLAVIARGRLLPDRTGVIRRTALLIRAGLRTNLATIALVLVWRADVFLVSWRRGLTEVGLYAVAVSVAEILVQVGVAARVALAPLQGDVGERDLLAGRIATVSRLTFAGGVLWCAAIALLAGPLVRLLFGASFAEAAPAVVALQPGVLLLVLQGPLVDLLLTEGRVRAVTGVVLSVLAANLVANSLVLQERSFVAAAVISTLSYLGSFLACALLFRQHTGVPLRSLLVVRPDDLRRAVGRAVA